MSLRKAVEVHWAGGHTVPGLGAALRLAGIAFGAASGMRNTLYDLGVLRQAQGPIPVLSVGNLTVGGTGKTPVVRWIVRALSDAGCRPAVLLRGYGGDETLLHRRWYPDVPVVEAPDRLQGVLRAAEEGANVVVCDDAFQHRRLARDLDIVLLDAGDERPVRLLPAGPYRELPRALTRADVVLVVRKGGVGTATDAVLARLGLEDLEAELHNIDLGVTGWSKLDGQPWTPPPVGPVLVATGVGAPESVRRLVHETLGVEIDLMPFPDHHEYSDSDVQAILRFAAARPIVTTEKDAVKLSSRKELYERVWVVGMDVTDVGDESGFRERLLSAASR